MAVLVARNLHFLIVLVLVVGINAQDDPCQGVSCPRGRICVASDNGGRKITQCVCPEECPPTNDPVCSVYNSEFPNSCEMHKFACANDVPIKVKNRGSCDKSDENANKRTNCPESRLLQFPSRYLEWLMINQRKSLNPKFQFRRSGDSLREDERREILGWEFDQVDKNEDGYLNSTEIQAVLNTVGPNEPCIYGFLQACDQNSQGRFQMQEWEGCFPLAGTAVGSKR